jgi:acyl-CoA thioester hydrolase
VFDTLTVQLLRQHIGVTSYAVGFDFMRAAQRVAQGEIVFACRGRDHAKTPLPSRLVSALQSLPESTP